MVPPAAAHAPRPAADGRPPGAPLSRARRTAYLAAPLLAFAAVLGGVELLVRLTRPHLDSLAFLVTAPKQRAAFTDRFQVGIFEGDPLLFWRLAPNLRSVVWDGTLVSTNAQGVRHDRPLRAKAGGAFRIVCAGDSVTFGYRVPRVYHRRPSDYDELPYPMLLEKRLREANPGRDVEVIALAVPGYSSHQGLAWLRRDLAALQPDLVTACFGWNDIDRRAATDRQAMPDGLARVAARAVVIRSQALMRASSWLRSLRAAPPPRAGPGVMRVPREEYVENLRGMARLARANGAAFAVIAPIYGNPVAHPPEGTDIAGHREVLRAAMAADRVPFLEVPELTEARYPENAPLFEEHIHPNHRGHRLLAERLLRFLEAQGLLRGLAVPGAAAPAAAAR
jgi:lysophospholipase L1-like esterase